MTILTLVYAANVAGNFIDSETGKCWNIPEDREFFRDLIYRKNVICGRKTFEKDWRAFRNAFSISVLTTGIEQHWPEKPDGVNDCPTVYTATSPVRALFCALSSDPDDEIYCVGGMETVEAMAPFASRMLVTNIINNKEIRGRSGFLSWIRGWYPDKVKGIPKQWQSRGGNRAYETIPGSDKIWSRYDFKRNTRIEL